MERAFYDVLNVRRDATEDEIRKAYKKAALKSHPDRHAATHANGVDPGEEFKRVNEAYTVLIDPSKRKLYDTYGVWPPPEDPGAPPRSTFTKRPGGSRRATDEFVFMTDPFFSMPTFFPGFDIPMPPFPGFPDIHAPHPVFPEPVFLVSEPLNMFDSVFTHNGTGMPTDEERTFFFDPLGGIHHPRHHRSHRPEPPNIHVHGPASYRTQPSPPDEASRQSSRSSSRHNSDTSYPKSYTPTKESRSHPIWVEEKHVRTVVNGMEEMYTMRRDAEGNTYETFKVAGKNEKYIVNGVDYLPAPEGDHIFVEEHRDSRRHDRSREARTNENNFDRKQHREPSRRPPENRRHSGGTYPAAPPPPLPPRATYEQPPPSRPGIPSYYPSAPPYPSASQPIMPSQVPHPPPQSYPIVPDSKGYTRA